MPRSFLGFILAVLGVTLLAPTVHAQGDTVITGTVTTRDDGLSVPGAVVGIPSLNLETATTPDGKYSLTIPASAPRTLELRVTAGGFRQMTRSITLSGEGVTADFALLIGFSEEVVVGSRASGAEAEKAVPVDVITSQQIAQTGYAETAQVIQAIAPSLNFPRPTITDGTDTVRPATLRGLGPDQVLVLVNGKRRHQSALVHLNGSVGRGSTGVDLNAIPVSAIHRIEVLRDGAAAQYGSDAIAGVINIVLKSGASPLDASFQGGLSKGSFAGNRCARTGTTCEIGDDIEFSDGELYDGGASKGFNVGRGSVMIAASYRYRNRTNRASSDPRDQIVSGDGGNNAVPQPNHRWGDPDTRDFLSMVDLQVPINADDTRQFYAFGGYSRREANSAGFYRRGNDARNWPQIYPLGFLPEIQPTVTDASGSAGIHGAAGEWFFDVNAGYGHNNFDFTIGNSLNTSLGSSLPPNQTVFDSGGLTLNQAIGNVDFSRPVKVSWLSGPLNVALGVEARHENYKIRAGELNSYVDGGVPDRNGNLAPLGAQVFPGFRPSNEIDEGRTGTAAYLDLEGDVVPWLRLGVAGRFEHYTDFGNTFNQKLTVRLSPDERFAIRGAVSTGFRAPSLGQSFFSSTATNFIPSPTGGLVPVESLTLPVAAPAARVLGAADLEPEDSVNLSAGFVWSPTESFDFTVDGYKIDIDKRVVLSGNFTGPRITELLRPFGANSGRFFTNAIDTSTKGIDATANYRADLGDGQSLSFQAGYNNTKTRIVGSIATPPQLAGFEAVLFDTIERRRIECGQPKDSVRLSGVWRSSRFGATARTARYGSFCSFSTGSATNPHQNFSPQWLTDLELSYTVQRLTFGIGSQNIFNVFPDRNIVLNSFNGIQTFPSHSPFGMNGRFLYVKVALKY